jgi:putative ATP-dependent endonuclease of OLD family
VVAATSLEDQPRRLFAGMFEREKGANIQKGAFGQALAQRITTQGGTFTVPPYIKSALEFVTND